MLMLTSIKSEAEKKTVMNSYNVDLKETKDVDAEKMPVVEIGDMQLAESMLGTKIQFRPDYICDIASCV